MQLFDTHFHFYGEVSSREYMDNVHLELDSPKQLAAGKVDRLFLNAVGADFSESCKAREFALASGDCVYSCGVHPHSAEKYLKEREDFSIFQSGIKPVAVGELGIDYFYGFSDRDSQLKVFEEFLQLSLQWSLPAIVHIRDKDESTAAYQDAFDILKDFSKSGGRFVVHCYAGNAGYAEKFLELGAFCGVTGMVTFRKAENIRENLKIIPLSRLFIETDAPYLAPVPHRGKENHPGFLIHVAAAAAKEYGISTEELADISWRNAFEFFKIT